MNKTIVFIVFIGAVSILSGYAYLAVAFWKRRKKREYRKLIQQKMEILAKLREEIEPTKLWVNVFQPNFGQSEVQP